MGRRTGAYPGMPASRELRVVFVSKDRPMGHAPAPEGARSLRYEGEDLVVGR